MAGIQADTYSGLIPDIFNYSGKVFKSISHIGSLTSGGFQQNLWSTLGEMAMRRVQSLNDLTQTTSLRSAGVRTRMHDHIRDSKLFGPLQFDDQIRWILSQNKDKEYSIQVSAWKKYAVWENFLFYEN